MQISDSDNTANIYARYKPGRRFYVFLISLVLASGFWLLNALNKTYSEVVTLSIKYINLPESSAFSPVPHNSIDIELSGDGYSLLQFRNIAEEDTVIIDVASLEFKTIGSRKKAQIPTSFIINDLRNELSNNVNVSRVNRDTIEVITEKGETKEILIAPNYSLSLAKGMVLKRPVYTVPEMVLTHGPSSIIENTQEILTENYDFTEVSEHTEVEVPLAYNSRLINPEFRSVKMVVEVESLTEGEIEVPIHVSGMPDSKRIRLLPNTIKLRYSTGLSHFDFIKPELFDVIVKYEDVMENMSKLPVTVRTHPSYVNVIQFIPERISYLKMDMELIDN
tara:strand:- start:23765 stop:24769 length:1005 start_codon:yes stop_codon:yes gene_type:complete